MDEKKEARLQKKLLEGEEREKERLEGLARRKEERKAEGLDPIWGRLPEEWELDPEGIEPQLTWSDEHNAPRNAPHRPGSCEWWLAHEDIFWSVLNGVEQEVLASRCAGLIPYFRRPYGKLEEIAERLGISADQARAVRDSAVLKLRLAIEKEQA